MTYDEFERRLLKIVFEEKKESLTPSFLAYKLQIPHTLVKEHLDHALENGIVELKIDEEGKFNYSVPGFDPNAISVRQYTRTSSSEADTPKTNPSNSSHYEDLDEEVLREVDALAPIAPLPKDEKQKELVDLPVLVDDSTDLTRRSRYSIYIRKIRLCGDYTKLELQGKIFQALASLAYKEVKDNSHHLLQPGNDLYKRGSFAFILLLLPLFILVLPLLFYAMLQVAGYSMIRNEPIYLEVNTKRLDSPSPIWEITFTYRGLHGIVFSQADQKLIDREVSMIESSLKE